MNHSSILNIVHEKYTALSNSHSGMNNKKLFKIFPKCSLKIINEAMLSTNLSSLTNNSEQQNPF